ncbi:MAG: L-aspartate oxidase [Planctomycetota bacterium]|jgi:L-aspartate oxidase
MEIRSELLTPRYLTNFDSSRSGNILEDVLVIGTGVAGIRAALEAAQFGMVTVLTKAERNESATAYAQGGISAAIGPDDSIDLHKEDTLRVGCGLGCEDAVDLLVREAPHRIEELIAWGMNIDRDGDVHAFGDQTGRELVRSMTARMDEHPQIRVFDHCYLIDFILVDGRCAGAITFHEKYGHQLIWAKRTILATGGCGRIWRETTNPKTATGDGLAAAYRAGARLASLEMMQFHPTTLYVAGAGRALISEAVRGAGAWLVDRDGRRFMADYDEAGELAPRDIVSRSIHTHLQDTRATCVFLDVRHIDEIAGRFPHLAGLCREFQIDIRKDLIPVRPSAHYMVGGVNVNLQGETSINDLLACGEAAHTGVHGANRLASNSLLEGLVFGKIVGEQAGQAAAGTANHQPQRMANRNAPSDRTELDIADIRHSLRSVMWRNTGILRRGDRLAETLDILEFWSHYTIDKTFNDIHAWETQNMLMLAYLVTASALARKESIGVHFRSDAVDETPPAPYLIEVVGQSEPHA